MSVRPTLAAIPRLQALDAASPIRASTRLPVGVIRLSVGFTDGRAKKTNHAADKFATH
jgi:hypothetical protein